MGQTSDVECNNWPQFPIPLIVKLLKVHNMTQTEDEIAVCVKMEIGILRSFTYGRDTGTCISDYIRFYWLKAMFQ